MPQHPVVVGVDGSESALRAVDWGAAQAARHGVPLHLLHAAGWRTHESVAGSRSAARLIARINSERIVNHAEQRARLTRCGVRITAESCAEDPVSALLRLGRQSTALVVGRGGGERRGPLPAAARPLAGRVHRGVASRAGCPVVVVCGRTDNRAGGFGRVVLAVGAGGSVPEAVEYAFQEAELRGCELQAVHAWRCPTTPLMVDPAGWTAPDPQSVETHRRRARHTLLSALRDVSPAHPAVPVRRSAVQGTPRQVLRAASAGADLLVVGARWRQGAFSLHLGLVVHTVLRTSGCPVAVIPEG
jgi:nucleotide-binding universal stress UspA family protein